MDDLVAKQGDLYETVKLVKPDLNNIFLQLSQVRTGSEGSESLVEFAKPVSSCKSDPLAVSSWWRATKAMFAIDFRLKATCKSILRWSLVMFLAIMQQLILIPFLENVAKPTLNFSNIESIFEEEVPLVTIGNPQNVQQ